jgi:hypothetical protein
MDKASSRRTNCKIIKPNTKPQRHKNNSQGNLGTPLKANAGHKVRHSYSSRHLLSLIANKKLAHHHSKNWHPAPAKNIYHQQPLRME